MIQIGSFCSVPTFGSSENVQFFSRINIIISYFKSYICVKVVRFKDTWKIDLK